jgi:hypothetical protein
MKKTEKILWSTFIIGLLFKIMHWPGAGILTVLSLALVSILYLYSGIGLFNNLSAKQMFRKKNYQYKKRFNLLFGALLGLVLSILVVGFLFKFMLWPGGNMMLSIGLISLLIIVSIYLVMKNNDMVSIAKSAFFRVALVSFISLCLFGIQTDSIVDFYYPNDPRYAEALKQIIHNPNDSAVQENFIKLKEEKMNFSQETEEKIDN